MNYFKASVSTKPDLTYQLIHVCAVTTDKKDDFVRATNDINGFHVHDLEMRITTYPSTSAISPFHVDFECVFLPHTVDAYRARAMVKALGAVERSIRAGEKKNGPASAGQKVLYAMRALKVTELVVVDEDSFRSTYKDGSIAQKIDSMVYVWEYQYTKSKEGE